MSKSTLGRAALWCQHEGTGVLIYRLVVKLCGTQFKGQLSDSSKSMLYPILKALELSTGYMWLAR